MNLCAFGSQVSSSALARVVIVVAPQKLADGEYRDTREALEKSKVAVIVVGVNLEICTGYGDIKAGGAIYQDMQAAADGNLVTGNGPDASQAFGAKVVEVLLTRVRK